MLGLASAFIVTEESVSMISEAAGTGKPIYLFPLTRLRQSRRMIDFQNAMISRHFVRWFDGKLDTWSYDPLNETRRVADLVLKKLQAERL